jgi:putative ABC transport system ATP-binding protein
MSPKPFVRDASLVVLAAFAVIEIASVLGFSPSFASIFKYPVSLIVGGTIILSSLLGAYGVFKDNPIAAYFSLLTPAAEVVLGFSFLIMASSQAGLEPIVVLQGSVVTLLGFLGIFLTARTLNQSLFSLNGTNLTKGGLDPRSDDHAVEVVDVTKRYIVGTVVVPAVNGLTLRIRKGEFVAVMGPSGCGKSTLLNLVGALDRPTSGRVLIDGIDVSEMNAYALAQLRNQKVGFVFQAYNLVNRSNVFRNVELPMLVRSASKDFRNKRTSEMLSVVGLESMKSRRPKTMSGGEQQRVAIARALVNNPKIILADEPTGNLDTKSGLEILSFLRTTNKELGTTVIMVTHNREAAEMADRIVYLRDGRIEKEELVRRTS